jgi:hypothetical protein
LDIEPLPNSPFELTPQHMTLPSRSKAQVYLLPAEIAVTLLLVDDAPGSEVTSPGAAVACVGTAVPMAVGVPVEGAAFDPHAATAMIAAAKSANLFDARPRMAASIWPLL